MKFCEEEDTENEICEAYLVYELVCVARRFCRAGRKAAKFAREAHQNERQSREKNEKVKPNLLAVSLLSPAFIT